MKSLFIMIAGLMVLSPHTGGATAPSLSLCSYECTDREPHRLSQNSWIKISALFQNTPESAEQERQKLAEAVALMERDIIDRLAREYSDDDFEGHLKEIFSNQDETRNSSRFIALLTDQGLVRLHVLRRSSQRHNLIGMTHSAAVIQCTEDGRLYAVDASRTAFGEAPVVAPLDDWKNDTVIKNVGNRVRSFLSNDDDDTRETDHVPE